MRQDSLIWSRRAYQRPASCIDAHNHRPDPVVQLSSLQPLMKTRARFEDGRSARSEQPRSIFFGIVRSVLDTLARSICLGDSVLNQVQRIGFTKRNWNSSSLVNFPRVVPCVAILNRLGNNLVIIRRNFYYSRWVLSGRHSACSSSSSRETIV